MFSNSSSLNPTVTFPSPKTIGLFINIPSDDNKLIFSSSVIVGKFVFQFKFSVFHSANIKKLFNFQTRCSNHFFEVLLQLVDFLQYSLLENPTHSFQAISCFSTCTTFWVSVICKFHNHNTSIYRHYSRKTIQVPYRHLGWIGMHD